MAWGLWGQMKSVNYPTDWAQAENMITTQNHLKTGSTCNGQILVLPWHLYMYFNWENHVILNPTPYFFACPTIRGTNVEYAHIYDNSANPVSQAVLKWIDLKGNTNLLTRSDIDIHYVVVLKEVDWQDYVWLEKIKNFRVLQNTDSLVLLEVTK